MPDRLRTVVFDLGGVLIDWNPIYVFGPHFDAAGDTKEASDRSAGAFLRDVFWPAHLDCHDSPAPFAETLAAWQARHPDLAEPIGMIDTHWPGFLGGPMGETVALLERLKAGGVPVFALSNWPAQKWPPAEKVPGEYGFLDHFGGIVVSGQEGMRKPMREIYELALDRFGLEAGETVFIDDLEENIAAAEAVGMQGIRFTDAADLETRLAAHGLL